VAFASALSAPIDGIPAAPESANRCRMVVHLSPALPYAIPVTVGDILSGIDISAAVALPYRGRLGR